VRTAKTYTIEISDKGCISRFSVLAKDSEKKIPKVNHIYYWYLANSIQKSNGGIGGKLLHGSFQSFYDGFALQESGKYRYGQKTGVWMLWYPNGTIKIRSKWKNGLLNGRSLSYSPDLKTCEESRYRSGLPDGKQKIYENRICVSVKKFENGKEIIKEKQAENVVDKKSFWKRFCSLFTKKKKQDE
jgi:antitoxin component YwqK of YwqJK toxin-antitoxin module